MHLPLYNGRWPTLRATPGKGDPRLRRSLHPRPTPGPAPAAPRHPWHLPCPRASSAAAWQRTWRR
eukprot:10283550-Alexandrium_andersonii.AAC.1